MHLSRLELRDFRSWAELDLDLEPGVTLLVGRNGYGKTNVVEAVGVLAHLSSHRVSSDAPLVRAGASAARVSATAINQGRQLSAHLLIKPSGSNLAQINRTRLRSPRELLGVVRSVLFAPEDLGLVRGEPALRRRYLDDIVTTRWPRLAGVKSDYDKALRQRTSLLKHAGPALRSGYQSSEGESALSTLDVWDQQLAGFGAQLIAARLAATAELSAHVHDAYAGIAPESRPARIAYDPTVPLDEAAGEDGAVDASLIEAAMLAELGRVRPKEIDRGLCLVGPHRDDLDLRLGDQPAKGFASHGETWSLAIALRFGEFRFLREAQGSDPVLILDDVFAELDAKRREKLVALAEEVEQVLITAAVDSDLPDNLARRISARHDVEVSDEKAEGGGVVRTSRIAAPGGNDAAGEAGEG